MVTLLTDEDVRRDLVAQRALILRLLGRGR